LTSIRTLTATMRWMTHVNLGATLGLLAWMVWLAAQPAATSQTFTLVSIESGDTALMRCAGPVPMAGPGRATVAGADL
jgi:hypothetical protein